MIETIESGGLRAGFYNVIATPKRKNMITKPRFHNIPECGWPCRLDDENLNRIDLNDGSAVVLEGEVYTWYDINGGVQETFTSGTDDFDNWAAVHAKLRTLT